MREDIELATREVLRLKYGRGLADRHHLGVSRRVVRLCHPVDSLRENMSVFDDDTRKRPSPLLDIRHRQVDRSLDEVHVGVSRDARSGQVVERLQRLTLFIVSTSRRLHKGPRFLRCLWIDAIGLRSICPAKIELSGRRTGNVQRERLRFQEPITCRVLALAFLLYDRP